MIVPSTSTRASLATAAKTYHEQLDGSPGQSYLESRGLMSAAADFLLGYVGDPISGDEWFQGRIAIPYLTPSGVVAMKYRAIDPGAEKKYLFPPGDTGRPFNTRVLYSAEVYVCEGELDAISAVVAGLPAIGIPGAQHWKPVFARMLRWHSVTVLADGDPAGRKFAEQVAKSIETCKIVSMPGNEDVNSVLVSSGPEGLRKLVGM